MGSIRPAAQYALVLALLGASAHGTNAADLRVVGLFPSKAVVVVDGTAPRTVAVGQKFADNITLIAVDATNAVFEIDGKRRTLGMGQVYVASAKESSEKVVLSAGRGGHFIADGRINGGSVRFLVDTGATSVALPAAEARRLGINYLNGARSSVQTANGAAPVFRVTLDSVAIGGITLYNIEAMVLEQGLAMPLLGMSFLTRTNMQREGETLTLIKRF